MDELVRRLGVTEEELRAVRPAYRRFRIPKRSGGMREVAAPEKPLKTLQRRILRRLLNRLPCHPHVTGFERGRSIATNAAQHLGKSVVVRMDIRDFFASTRSVRVEHFFRRIGWSSKAAQLLVHLCTDRGGLPQGAPTSPRLANLVNYRLDARLAALAAKAGATYTRYADDLTFSFDRDDPHAIHMVIRTAKLIAGELKYGLHQRKKLRIHRRHQRQLVTGLVVNERVNLPRRTRRRLRAIEHHLCVGRPATLTSVQLAGWKALQMMLARQTQAGG